jgi:hypothetical protein
VRAALAVAAALVLVGGCSVGPDDSPRDIDPDVLEEVPLTVPGGGAAAGGTERIYLVRAESDEGQDLIEAVARDVAPDARAVLEALVAGPNVVELEEQFRTALPADLRLLDVRGLGGGVLAVDLSDDITRLSGDALITAVAQVVFTATALTDVRAVLMTVDGASTQWPAGNGELRSDPLTVYDYPGVERSSQPPYPGLPAA